MLVYEKNAVSEYISDLTEKYGKKRSSLLPILQDIQRKYNYISDFAQQEVARLLDIHPVEVYSVISFYAFLYDKPRGRNIVRLCKTIVCSLSGTYAIADAVRRELGIDFGETTKDGRVTLEYANCIGMCDKSPAMLVNEKVYSGLDPETACKILREIK
jgi:NADH:ubiquinone oxidoreductase subunit E